MEVREQEKDNVVSTDPSVFEGDFLAPAEIEMSRFPAGFWRSWWQMAAEQTQREGARDEDSLIWRGSYLSVLKTYMRNYHPTVTVSDYQWLRHHVVDILRRLAVVKGSYHGDSYRNADYAILNPYRVTINESKDKLKIRWILEADTDKIIEMVAVYLRETDTGEQRPKIEMPKFSIQLWLYWWGRLVFRSKTEGAEKKDSLIWKGPYVKLLRGLLKECGYNRPLPDRWFHKKVAGLKEAGVVTEERRRGKRYYTLLSPANFSIVELKEDQRVLRSLGILEEGKTSREIERAIPITAELKKSDFAGVSPLSSVQQTVEMLDAKITTEEAKLVGMREELTRIKREVVRQEDVIHAQLTEVASIREIRATLVKLFELNG